MLGAPRVAHPFGIDDITIERRGVHNFGRIGIPSEPRSRLIDRTAQQQDNNDPAFDDRLWELRGPTEAERFEFSPTG